VERRTWLKGAAASMGLAWLYPWQPAQAAGAPWGLCIHSSFRSSPVYSQDARVQGKIVGVGASYVRDYMLPAGTLRKFDQVALWASYRDLGIRVHATVGVYKSPFTEAQWTTVEQTLDRNATSLFQVAGWNEPDQDGVPISQWLAPTVAHQQRLYLLVKSNPATAHLQVGLGALRGMNRNLEAEMRELTTAARGFYDFVNWHAYPAKSPVPAYLDTRFAWSESMAPGVPIVVSEMGCSSARLGLSRQAQVCKEAVQHCQLRGVTGFVYEAMDDPNPAGTDVQSNFGIWESDFTPKPAATALQGL